MGFRKVVVGTTPTLVLSFNPRRVCWTIKNYSGSTAFISENPANIVSEGFPLGVGEFISYIKKDGDSPEYAIYAQTESGTAELRVQESFSEEGGKE